MEKYFKFEGVATRSEFWAVTIITSIASVILGGIAGVLIGAGGAFGIFAGSILFLGVLVASVWISIATGVRRCKDNGLNPWWILASIIPYIGAIVWIVIGVMPSKGVENGN